MNTKSWDNLFSSIPDGATVTLKLRVLAKQGSPLFALPDAPLPAIHALALYSAQSSGARLAIRLLRLALAVRLPLPLKRTTLKLNEADPFVRFLRYASGSCPTAPFAIAILAGNPRVPGRRFVILVFDADGRPSAVVKAGAGARARELIIAERHLFSAVSPKTGAPRMIGEFHSESVDAFAMNYVQGYSPDQPGDDIAALLTSWVNPKIMIPLGALPAWKRLMELPSPLPAVKQLFDGISEWIVCPVLFHGDFAPWNVKVEAGDSSWTVLDWERGERLGVPGWDWFHFIVQTLVLIEKRDTPLLAMKLERLLASPSFQAYAATTKIRGIEREILLSYLFYSIGTFSQTEGSRQIVELYNRLCLEMSKRVPTRPRALANISVITPSYKQLDLLKLCAASVNDQEGVEVEHLIQDAESGPEVTEWVQAHTQAKLFVESDSGMYDAINRGFRRSTGEIVAWLNCDEQYLPGALVKVAVFFETHPKIDVLFGDAVLINDHGDLLSYRHAILPTQRHTQLSHLNTLSCATFVRRSVLERGFYLRSQWKAIADAVWVAEMLEAKIPMAVLNEPLSAFTITEKNLGQTSLAHREMKRWRDSTNAGTLWMRIPVILMHRFEKLIHGAYAKRSLTAFLYTAASPAQRQRVRSNNLSFGWVGSPYERSQMGLPQFLRALRSLFLESEAASSAIQAADSQPTGGGPGTSRRRLGEACHLLLVNLIAPLLAGLLVLLLDRTIPGVTITPILSTLILLGVAAYLGPARVIAFAAIFAGSVAYAVRFQQRFDPHDITDWWNLWIRVSGFLVGSTLAFLFSHYRIRARRHLDQTLQVLLKIPAPIVLSDAAGYITFVNDEAERFMRRKAADLLGQLYVTIFRADQGEGTAMRSYIELFADQLRAGEEEKIVVDRGEKERVAARLMCVGEGEERALLTVLLTKPLD